MKEKIFQMDACGLFSSFGELKFSNKIKRCGMVDNKHSNVSLSLLCIAGGALVSGSGEVDTDIIKLDIDNFAKEELRVSEDNRMLLGVKYAKLRPLGGLIGTTREGSQSLTDACYSNCYTGPVCHVETVSDQCAELGFIDTSCPSYYKVSENCPISGGSTFVKCVEMTNIEKCEHDGYSITSCPSGSSLSGQCTYDSSHYQSCVCHSDCHTDCHTDTAQQCIDAGYKLKSDFVSNECLFKMSVDCSYNTDYKWCGNGEEYCSRAGYTNCTPLSKEALYGYVCSTCYTTQNYNWAKTASQCITPYTTYCPNNGYSTSTTSCSAGETLSSCVYNNKTHTDYKKCDCHVECTFSSTVGPTKNKAADGKYYGEKALSCVKSGTTYYSVATGGGDAGYDDMETPYACHFGGNSADTCNANDGRGQFYREGGSSYLARNVSTSSADYYNLEVSSTSYSRCKTGYKCVETGYGYPYACIESTYVSQTCTNWQDGDECSWNWYCHS